MNDHDLLIVIGALRKKHPTLMPHLKALTAMKGTPVADAATEVLQTLLRVFDEGEQAKWQLRDLLKRMPSTGGGHYLSLKYGAVDMVHRIAVAGGMDVRETTYFSDKQPPEIANWKAEEPDR